MKFFKILNNEQRADNGPILSSLLVLVSPNMSLGKYQPLIFSYNNRKKNVAVYNMESCCYDIYLQTGDQIFTVHVAILFIPSNVPNVHIIEFTVSVSSYQNKTQTHHTVLDSL